MTGSRSTEPPSRRLAAAGLILLAVLLAYGNTLANGFVWDDHALILQDERLRSDGLVGEIFSHDFFAHSDDQVKYGYYRPLVTLSYLLDMTLWGVDPAGFHATNLMLHLACCLLVFALGRVLLPESRAGPLAAALIFAVHPVHTESVAWIAGRTDLLATLLFLLAWLVHERAAARSPDEAGRRWRIGLALALFFLALLAKEMAATLPLILFLVAWIRRGRPGALRESWPYAAVLALYLVLRLAVVEVSVNPSGLDAGYLASLAQTFWRYAGELIWPFPLEAYIRNPRVEELGLWPLLALAGCIGLGIAAWRLRHRPLVMLLLGGFLLSLLPLSNLIRISAPRDMGFPMSERLLYLPSVFFCWGLGRALFATQRARWLRLTALVVICAGCAAAAFDRNRDWRDDGTLFESVVAQAPDAPLPLGRLGVHYSLKGEHARALAALRAAAESHQRLYGGEDLNVLNDLAAAYRRAGDPRSALMLLRRLEAAGYDGPVFLVNLGETLLGLGRLDEAEAAFFRSLEQRPSSLDGRMGLARVETGRGEHAVALRRYEEALALYPLEAQLHVAIGDLHRRRGDREGARAEYRRALKMRPELASAEAALGALLAEEGRSAEAAGSFRRALALDPLLSEARVALAILIAEQGDAPRAEAMLDAVLARDPGHEDALMNRAVLFGRTGRVARARRDLHRILGMNPRHPGAAALLARLDAAASPGPQPAPATEPSP